MRLWFKFGGVYHMWTVTRSIESQRPGPCPERRWYITYRDRDGCARVWPRKGRT